MAQPPSMFQLTHIAPPAVVEGDSLRTFMKKSGVRKHGGKIVPKVKWVFFFSVFVGYFCTSKTC